MPHIVEGKPIIPEDKLNKASKKFGRAVAIILILVLIFPSISKRIEKFYNESTPQKQWPPKCANSGVRSYAPDVDRVEIKMRPCFGDLISLPMNMEPFNFYMEDGPAMIWFEGDKEPIALLPDSECQKKQIENCNNLGQKGTWFRRARFRLAGVKKIFFTRGDKPNPIGPSVAIEESEQKYENRKEATDQEESRGEISSLEASSPDDKN